MSASAIWNIAVQAARERIFNVPRVVLAMAVLMGLIHALLAWQSSEVETEVLLRFAFIPARYDLSWLADASWATGWGAAVWSFVTYAFLHANVDHLLINLIWLAAFGTPVARRLGPLRFIAFFLVCAAAGAAAHLVTHLDEVAPAVGASAGIAGAMGGTLRFLFGRGGQINMQASGEGTLHLSPAMPIAAMLRNRRVLVIVLVSIGVYALFGLSIFALPGIALTVAWEAHVGGFLMGLLAFTLFDPLRHLPVLDEDSEAASEPAAQAPGHEPMQDQSHQ